MPGDTLAPAWQEWHNRLDHINKHHNSQAISTTDRHHLMAFPETVVLVELMLNAPKDHVDARTLYRHFCKGHVV